MNFPHKLTYSSTKFCALLFSFILLSFTFQTESFAQEVQTENSSQNASRSGSVNLRALVGDFLISVTGTASAKAAITLSNIDSLTIATRSAGPRGGFLFENIPVDRGLSGLCFDTVDFNKLGKSSACHEFSPLMSATSISKLFLPPTIGLESALIDIGSEAKIYGYSVSSAKISITTDRNDRFETQTDDTGYYEYVWEDVPEGTYLISATGTLGDTTSLPPRYQATLIVGNATISEDQSTTDKIATTVSDSLFKNIYLFVAAIILITAISVGFYIKLKRPDLILLMLNKLKAVGKKQNLMHDDWLIEFISKLEKS